MGKQMNSKSILFISHDSLLGGATIALQYAGKALKRNGYYVVFLLPSEGGITKELEQDRIDYIVDPTLLSGSEWVSLAVNFDIIFLSTLLTGNRLEYLRQYDKRVIWWIHEASDYYRRINFDKRVFRNKNLQVLCGGGYAQKLLKEHFPEVNSKVLIYGVPDYRETISSISTTTIEEKLIFLSVGTIEKRKGQDILCEAIKMLTDEEREKCTFWFVGKNIEEDIYKKIEKLQEKYSKCIVIIPPVSRNKLMDLYRKCTCVICSSREDPMPVFMTECMMEARIPICSENTGTAQLLIDGYNGLVYHNNSAAELSDKIRWIISHLHEVDKISINARKTYEKYFSMPVFEENLLKIIKEAVVDVN